MTHVLRNLALVLLPILAGCDEQDPHTKKIADGTSVQSSEESAPRETRLQQDLPTGREQRSGGCAMDSRLVRCPAPRVPLVTELTSGHVVVRVSVRPDGSVADAKIISSTGHAAWPAAVLEAVRSWQFEHSANGFTKDLPFTLDVDRD